MDESDPLGEGRNFCRLNSERLEEVRRSGSRILLRHDVSNLRRLAVEVGFERRVSDLV